MVATRQDLFTPSRTRCGDDGKPGGKRLDEHIWVPLEARRKHEEAGLLHDPDAVLGETGKRDPILVTALVGEALQRSTLRPLPVNDKPPVAVLAGRLGKALQENIEAFLLCQAPHRHNGRSTLGARCGARLDADWVGDDLHRNAEALPGPGRDLLGL